MHDTIASTSLLIILLQRYQLAPKAPVATLKGYITLLQEGLHLASKQLQEGKAHFAGLSSQLQLAQNDCSIMETPILCRDGEMHSSLLSSAEDSDSSTDSD